MYNPTYADIIRQSIPGRDIQRQTSAAAEIARLERWVADCAHLSWTAGYKANVARLNELKGAK